MKRMPDVFEKAGNKVPHPVTIFLVLIVVICFVAGAAYGFGAGTMPC